MFKDNKELLRPDWSKMFPELVCGFSLPFFGNQALTRRSRTSGLTTAENRIKLFELLGFSVEEGFSPHQIHSDRIIEVDDKNIGSGALVLENALQGDSCLTSRKGTLLITTWADCIPVILWDPELQLAASIHSGWRGTEAGILQKTMDTMLSKGSRKEDLYAAVGPGIRGCCYQVGEEFIEYFEHKRIGQYLIPRDDGLYFDLSQAVYQQLLENNIKENKIDFASWCTCCYNKISFFSCRKDGQNFEAQAAFIGMK